MPGQLPPLTGEEAKKYEILMQKSVRVLRAEAKVCLSSLLSNSSYVHPFQRAELCAGAKTKSELAYSMVKEKRPRRCVFFVHPFWQRLR